MQPRERIPYSSPFHRPPLQAPGGARLIVWPVVNIEEWDITRPMPRQASHPPNAAAVAGAVPDMPNWTWHEYGMRVGFWRLLEAFEKRGIKPTVSLNSRVCATCPPVAAAIRDAGWEVMAHCVEQMPIQQIRDQRAMIAESVAQIAGFFGKKPNGWLGPGRTQTFETLDLVAEAGLDWFGDWILDDQPLWVKTTTRPLVAVPYSVELNDITIMVTGLHESDAMLKRTIDACDRLLAESAQSVRVLAFGVHPYVSGASHRIRYFETLLDHLQNTPGVAFMNGDAIRAWYAAQVPAPAQP
jgi:peptidoglycan/xylan/chitin deacetylase (PgdA/CDA1 family)